MQPAHTALRITWWLLQGHAVITAETGIFRLQWAADRHDHGKAPETCVEMLAMASPATAWQGRGSTLGGHQSWGSAAPASPRSGARAVPPPCAAAPPPAQRCAAPQTAPVRSRGVPGSRSRCVWLQGRRIGEGCDNSVSQTQHLGRRDRWSSASSLYGTAGPQRSVPAGGVAAPQMSVMCRWIAALKCS